MKKKTSIITMSILILLGCISSSSDNEKTEQNKVPSAAVKETTVLQQEENPSETITGNLTEQAVTNIIAEIHKGTGENPPPSFSASDSKEKVEPQTQTTEWKAPPEANKLVNPCKGKAAETEKGKTTYNIYCFVCHGNAGKGDGESGKALVPKPGDFTSLKVQKQTDGAIFWKMTNGRAPMAPYKDILKEEQRWQLVNYIRELGKTTATTAVKTTEHPTTKSKQ